MPPDNNSKDRRPNIILIVSDDHGREALGCYGNTVVQTPNLDALAAGGIVFDSAFCTTASCASSRSVILTGLHNHTNRTFGHTHSPHNFSLAAGIKTLPVYLKQAGYRTGRIGKQHYRPVEQFPFDWDPMESTKSVVSYDDAAEHTCADDEEFRRLRDDIWKADHCLPFLSEESDEPFFLYYASYNPHREKLRLEHPLQPDDFGNPTEDFPNDKEVVFDPDSIVVPDYLEDTPGTRAEIAEYYQSIHRLDRGIGKLVQNLEKAGQLDNTVILYISDNGGAFPVAKTTLYEPGMRLPFILNSPLHSSTAGTRNQALVNWADIVPTILDFAGTTLPEDPRMLGTSIIPTIDNPDARQWREELFAAHSFHQITNYYPMRVIRTQQYKFIFNIAWQITFPTAADLWSSASWQSARRAGSTIGHRQMEHYLNRPRFELYDLDADPGELNNLAALPEYAEKVEHFCERIRHYQSLTDDPWLHKWEYE